MKQIPVSPEKSERSRMRVIAAMLAYAVGICVASVPAHSAEARKQDALPALENRKEACGCLRPSTRIATHRPMRCFNEVISNHVRPRGQRAWQYAQFR